MSSSTLAVLQAAMQGKEGSQAVEAGRTELNKVKYQSSAIGTGRALSPEDSQRILKSIAPTPREAEVSEDDADSEGAPAKESEGGKVEEASDNADSKEDAKPSAELPDEEEINITDDKGSRKLKVNFKDRESIKNAFAQAAGMRKFQAERDALKNQVKELEEHKEAADAWRKVEDGWGRGGEMGLMRAIFDDQAEVVVQKLVKEYLDREQMSDAERRAYDAEKRLAMIDREKKWESQLSEKDKKRLAQKQEVDKQKSFESVVNPAFEKYRFEGTNKVADTVQAHKLDKMVWAAAMKEIQNLPEDQPVTPEIVDQIFKDAASVFDSVIEKKAEAKVKQVLDQKKEDAKGKVVDTLSVRAQASDTNSEIRKKARSGDTLGALMAALKGK